MNTSPVITPDAADYIRVLPEIVLSIFGMAIMLVDPLLKERRRPSTLGTIALLVRSRLLPPPGIRRSIQALPSAT